jgi:hypothetical protein
MADNLALKLVVAGIIGAVVGAAAADRYRFPTGLVYGGLNRPPTAYRTGPAIDPTIGSGRAEGYGDDGPRVEWGTPPDWPDLPQPSELPRWRPPARSPARTALCWREFEDWDFSRTGHYVRCNPGSSGRSYRPRRDG